MTATHPNAAIGGPRDTDASPRYSTWTSVASRLGISTQALHKRRRHWAWPRELPSRRMPTEGLTEDQVCAIERWAADTLNEDRSAKARRDATRRAAAPALRTLAEHVAAPDPDGPLWTVTSVMRFAAERFDADWLAKLKAIPFARLEALVCEMNRVWAANAIFGLSDPDRRRTTEEWDGLLGTTFADDAVGKRIVAWWNRLTIEAMTARTKRRRPRAA